jgi:hypothetical protein
MNLTPYYDLELSSKTDIKSVNEPCFMRSGVVAAELSESLLLYSYTMKKKDIDDLS